jgi:DNA-binding response OmpR family regulator
MVARMAALADDAVLPVADLDIRPDEGLVVAAGRAVPMSAREVGVLVALASRAGRTLRREELYALVWGRALRDGDRSIDVYVHKVRAKLEAALPQWRFIHTHRGFGYRFSPERSQAFHTPATGA